MADRNIFQYLGDTYDSHLKDSYPEMFGQLERMRNQYGLPSSSDVMSSSLGALTLSPIARYQNVAQQARPEAVENAIKGIVEAVNPASTGQAVKLGGSLIGPQAGAVEAAKAATEMAKLESNQSLISQVLSYLGL